MIICFKCNSWFDIEREETVQFIRSQGWWTLIEIKYVVIEFGFVDAELKFLLSSSFTIFSLMPGRVQTDI